MGRGKKVTLDAIEFANQGQATAFFRAMLNRYIPGERLTPIDAAHLASLLKRHPNYTTKVGIGIAYLQVIPADYGTQCFCVVRADGSTERFSYGTCITQRTDS